MPYGVSTARSQADQLICSPFTLAHDHPLVDLSARLRPLQMWGSSRASDSISRSSDEIPFDSAGFRALGWNIFFSFIFTIILNGSLSYATQDVCALVSCRGPSPGAPSSAICSSGEMTPVVAAALRCFVRLSNAFPVTSFLSETILKRKSFLGIKFNCKVNCIFLPCLFCILTSGCASSIQRLPLTAGC